jgi:hypothetical protein
MNIVTPIPTTLVFNTANVNTESARRDNVQRETIPQSSAADNSAAETGLGSEADRAKTPGKLSQPLTYEKPQVSPGEQSQVQDGLDKDNAEDPSAGKQNADDKQQQQAEQVEIDKLATRDREVRAHEQAHAGTGGQYAASPSYEYERGPDGKQYAANGEVSIDISAANTPQETLRKMQQVQAAALSPAEPSAQDLRVASEARQKAIEARAEIVKDNAAATEKTIARAFPDIVESSNVTSNVSGVELDDIVKGSDVGAPTRSLSDDPVAEAVGLESNPKELRRALESRDSVITQRVAVIESFYQKVTAPRQYSLQQNA